MPSSEARLIHGPVKPLLVRLTIPMVFGMVSMITFNLVDTFFVGHLGTRELAALSFTFPVVMIISHLALGLGIGASVVISRAIGAGDIHRVQRLTTDSLILSLMVVFCFVMAGLFTIDPLFRLMGAGEELLVFIRQYMIVWYPGVLFVIVPMVGNNAIRASGDSRTPGLIMMAAAGINCILDPLFIFGIGPFPRLEIRGAALATVLSRSISMVIALYVLHRRKNMLTFRLRPLKESLRSWKSILYIGLPASGARIIIPLGVGVITRMVSRYGTEAVAGFGVSSRIDFFAVTVLASLASILGPFVGQNLGAGKINRVRESILSSVNFSLAWGAFMTLLLAFAAPHVAVLFNPNPLVIRTISLYLHMVPVGYAFQGMLLLCSSTLNVLKKPIHAAGISILQMFVLYVPLAYAGSRALGLPGIFGALPVSYLITGLAGRRLVIKFIGDEERSALSNRNESFEINR
jgi:putative MATE family efflux protein